jgi:hypothetical protein
LLQTLPVQLAALARALAVGRSRAALEVAAVASGIVAIQGAAGASSLAALPLPLQGLWLLAPVLAPAALLTYVISTAPAAAGADHRPAIDRQLAGGRCTATVAVVASQPNSRRNPTRAHREEVL